MENKSKYYVINSIRLAKALSYLGFDYYAYKGINGETIYSFIDSKELRQAKRTLINLRKLYHEDYK
ncbi:hypothetical protein [Clostridium sp.]|uniref:hypothetical protein n=1 Tax=Clostridium sp. TaxID=1506 RepID=UPI0039961443